MIIYRYLSRQLLYTTLAVTVVLSLILVGARFIKYFSEVAEGRIAGDVLLALVVYRLPGFLEAILPLGLFLGILLAYGRLYMDQEMTVLAACGVGPSRLLRHTAFPTLCMLLAVGFCSLYLSPLGVKKTEEIFQQQENQSTFAMLTPGRFYQNFRKNQVTYVQQLSANEGRMEHLLIIERQPDSVVVITAASGQRRFDTQTGVQYLDLHDGYRYQAYPGRAASQVTHYLDYSTFISVPAVPAAITRLKAIRSDVLWKQTEDRAVIAELYWRLSLPFLVPIVSLIAFALSKVNPRQGRFVKMVPAILLYLLYLFFLTQAKVASEKEAMTPWVAFMSVHAAFFCVAVGLNVQASLSRMMRRFMYWFHRTRQPS